MKSSSSSSCWQMKCRLIHCKLPVASDQLEEREEERRVREEREGWEMEGVGGNQSVHNITDIFKLNSF